MAVVGGVCCGGDACMKRHDSFNLFNFQKPNVRPRRFMASNPQPSSKPIKPKIPAAASKMISLHQPLATKQEKKKHNELLYEEIDEWMRDSVAEIVKKLPESPLLVHVFSDVKNNTTKIRAEEEKWVLVRHRWEKGESPMPGVDFGRTNRAAGGGVGVEGMGDSGSGNWSCWFSMLSIEDQ
ncbi:hypothetical protein HRI_002719100 [Hibiscus trionum]|nr:hypothetical protein HRI_002719100 [Hibiscus trionum]